MAQRTKSFLWRHGPLLTTTTIFFLAYFIGSRMYPAMQKPQVFFNLFINNGSLLLVSIGMTLVILTGGIDLSVGGVLALTTVASAALLRGGMNPALVIILMIVMGVIFGSALGAIIQYLKVQPFIVTLMGLFFARGMAYIISLTSVTITDSVYKIGIISTLYSLPSKNICLSSNVGSANRVIGGHLSVFLHTIWPHDLCHWKQ